jgi:UDP-3-O-acyl-N-acetylglucosamine deacetylase
MIELDAPLRLRDYAMKFQQQCYVENICCARTVQYALDLESFRLQNVIGSSTSEPSYLIRL